MGSNSVLSPGPSSFPILHRRLTKYRPLLSSSRKLLPFPSAVFNSRKRGQEDFISRVIEDNPSQVERRFLVGDRLLTKHERTARNRPALGDDDDDDECKAREVKAVYLKDILREFKGQLYVPEEAFESRLSEEEVFDRNAKVLPKLTLDDFLKYLRADKVKLLTFKSPAIGVALYRDLIVDLKEIPGLKELHRTKWAIRLSGNRLNDVLMEYNVPRYEIERHASYAGKILERPNPVASSISSRIMAEFFMITALMALVVALIGGFAASAVLYVAPFFVYFCVFVVVPLVKPFIKLLPRIFLKVFQIASDAMDNFFGYGGTLSRVIEFYSYGGLSDTLSALKPILFVTITMVLLIRFTLSRRPKNFRKWDIWQGIEFSRSKPQARVDGSTGVLFGDVAGIDEAVEELQELVEYLKNPKLFDERKIKAPHGVLLEGPPGCGKTLVAKAIAGEAGVPFYQMAGSEFIEVLVGVGSARIRDLFMRAKVNMPSVVFIDEIDALGTRRQAKFNEKDDEYNASTHERETTLNQLLIELDGFDTGKGVIFLAATNRMDLLDPALLRPGRFDRKIRILPPGTKGRLDILKVHASKVKMFPTVDLSAYAQNLTGWSGAQLAQLLQEAALVAVRNKHSSIFQSDLDDAVDRLTIGPKHEGKELSRSGRKRRATVEVGTAITSHLLRCHEDAEVEPCERISINPRGETFSQVVFRRLDDEAYTYERRPQLLHRLQVLLGARAAEEIIYGKDTSKESLVYLSDASWLARKILSIWNLEDPMTIHGEPCPWTKPHRFAGPRMDFERSLYDDYGLFEPPINHDLDVQVARRTEKLISEMYGKTMSLLRRHQAALIKTIKVLLDRREINRDHIEHILEQYPADTSVTLVLKEKNPESLPLFEVDGQQPELLFSQDGEKEVPQLI